MQELRKGDESSTVVTVAPKVGGKQKPRGKPKGRRGAEVAAYSSGTAGGGAEWVKQWDENYQAEYWYNQTTGESTWEVKIYARCVCPFPLPPPLSLSFLLLFAGPSAPSCLPVCFSLDFCSIMQCLCPSLPCCVPPIDTRGLRLDVLLNAQESNPPFRL